MLLCYRLTSYRLETVGVEKDDGNKKRLRILLARLAPYREGKPLVYIGGF